MVTVFPGWYIKVTRKSFLSRTWRVTLYDGFTTALAFENDRKDNVTSFSKKLLDDVCKDWLERCKKENPEAFKQILADDNIMWNTKGKMGKLPIGKIAKKIYP